MGRQFRQEEGDAQAQGDGEEQGEKGRDQGADDGDHRAELAGHRVPLHAGQKGKTEGIDGRFGLMPEHDHQGDEQAGDAGGEGRGQAAEYGIPPVVILGLIHRALLYSLVATTASLKTARPGRKRAGRPGFSGPPCPLQIRFGLYAVQLGGTQGQMALPAWSCSSLCQVSSTILTTASGMGT